MSIANVEVCGAAFPDRPGDFCRREKDHEGPHAVATGCAMRRDAHPRRDSFMAALDGLLELCREDLTDQTVRFYVRRQIGRLQTALDRLDGESK